MGDRHRHVLVFEPDARGHVEEWLAHIVRFVCDAHPPVRVTLAVPDALVAPLAALVPSACDAPVGFLALDDGQCAPCLARPLTRAALARWRLLCAALAATRADAVEALCLDMLSVPLALGRTLGGRPLGGILFRPSGHYRGFDPSPPTAAERVRDARKRLLYPMMLRNPTLTRVLSLDPYFAAAARQDRRNGHKVLALADPAAVPPPAVVTRGRGPFPEGRTGFLLFGELTPRKGILQLLDACALVDDATAARAAVLITGRLAPELRDAVKARLAAVRAARPGLWIEIAARRLATDELAASVAACDVVLAPYQRFVGSSGVLVWAAGFGRPVITQSYGMLGRSVEEYALGLALDTTRPCLIAEALATALGGPAAMGFDAARARTFAAGRDGATFAARVLGVGEPSPPTLDHGKSRRRLAGTTA